MARDCSSVVWPGCGHSDHAEVVVSVRVENACRAVGGLSDWMELGYYNDP